MTNENGFDGTGFNGSDAFTEESDDRDIQELLDIGYDQLDGFVNWLEEALGQDARTAQQDCFNAESLIDFLANHQRKEASAILEFDLRWFLFSHYIRKVHADPQIQDRLLESVQRYYDFLTAEHSASPPAWLEPVLDDQDYYQHRRETYEALNDLEEKDWKEGYAQWCNELEEDLDTRCLWLPNEMGSGLYWQDRMGWREATLREEANRIWQSEREELLMDGLDFESVRERLGESYLIWLDTPQDRLDGQTPRDTILLERSETVEIRDERDEED